MAAVSSKETGINWQSDGSFLVGGFGSWEIQLCRWPGSWEPGIRVNTPLYDIAYGADTFVAVGSGCVLQSDRLSATTPIRLTTAREPSTSVRLTVESVPGTQVSVDHASTLGNWTPGRSFLNSSGLESWLEPADGPESRQFFRATGTAP